MEIFGDTQWIWKPNVTAEEVIIPVFVMFRKTFFLEAVPKNGKLSISADSRYKFYVNGSLVEVGPSKGDNQIWFLDTVDITQWLKKGKNCIAIEVLHYPVDKMKGNFSVFRTETPGLYVNGKIEDTKGNRIHLKTDTSWKCKRRKERTIVPEGEIYVALQIYEATSNCEENLNWEKEEYDDKEWDNAVPYKNYILKDSVSPGNLVPRTIPFMYRKKKYFQKILNVCGDTNTYEQWNAFLSENQEIVIDANQECTIEISAGEEMTGYLYLAMVGGENTEIEIVQAEAYMKKTEDGNYKKGVRDDFKKGTLSGYKDCYYVCGKGTDEIPERFEPFWFRTFRFIKLKIKTKKEALKLKYFYYEETGYPLKVVTKVKTSEKSFEDIWDISERTLRRCMHETYEDCPYYEQLQYAMDTRAQILYTYQIAADDRLARKCMDDFKRSQRYDGLINCCYPSVTPNIIPGFSIYYILMLYDHMMYFGDKELIKEHMPAIENIFNFFERHLDEKGYVGKIGGLNIVSRYWSFIDWTPQWRKTSGVPDATLTGPITMESLLYILGLEKAAELAKFIGRKALADDFEVQSEKVKKAVLNHCVGMDGMIQDGPGVEKYSQHCQVFAILTDLITVEQGRKNLLKTLNNKDDYAQCSVAMMYYLFRALEKTELYSYTSDYWNIWREMLQNHLTTCVEDNVSGRSDCHAWGAVILYELPATILGVKPASPGYTSVSIKPRTENLDFAKGSVITPKGMIEVVWEKNEDQGITLNYQLPEHVKCVN